MNPCELTTPVTAIANALACKLSVNELPLLDTQFGDILSIIVVQRIICETIESKSDSLFIIIIS